MLSLRSTPQASAMPVVPAGEYPYHFFTTKDHTRARKVLDELATILADDEKNERQYVGKGLHVTTYCDSFDGKVLHPTRNVVLFDDPQPNRSGHFTPYALIYGHRPEALPKWCLDHFPWAVAVRAGGVLSEKSLRNCAGFLLATFVRNFGRVKPNSVPWGTDIRTIGAPKVPRVPLLGLYPDYTS